MHSRHLTVALFTLALAGALWALTRAWDKPLLDLHSFRQTQTAISTYYMVGNPSVFLDYETPVLGKPWAIPMEMPLYQWLVARWHDLTGMGLDQSGKFVSIAFLFACLMPIWKLLSVLQIPTASRWLMWALFLSVPLHLYWGRAFLIETMGLFLSLAMVACVFAGFRGKNWRWLAAGLAFGILAAFCKITTWAVACGVAGLLVLFSEGLPKRKDFGWLVAAGMVAVLPLVPGKLWLSHGDAVKGANPFTRELLIASSAKQAAWNFGTWEQKTSAGVWEHIGRHITDQLLVPLPLIGSWLVPLILLAGMIVSAKRRASIGIFLVGFAAGPLIFTNLYFEHNYYWVANSVWMLLAVGVALAGIAEWRPRSSWPSYVALAFCTILCISGFAAWQKTFLPILEKIPTRAQLAEAWIDPIQKIVPSGRTILILSRDWNPNAHYFAERKGISFPTGDRLFEFDGKTLHESITLLSPGEALGAVVINPEFLTEQNALYFSNLLRKLGMRETGLPSPFGIVFPAIDLALPK